MSSHSPLRGRVVVDDEHTVTLWYIQRRLGARRLSDRAMPAYVTALIASKGFPPPLPGFRKGELVEHVTRNSRWMRPAVETWFDNYLPPEALAAMDAAALAEAAGDMDAAAQGLGALRVVGGTHA